MDAAQNRRAARSAALCAVLGLAVQVGGKAARDAIFLTRHDVTTLPLMVTLAALLSFGGALLLSRLMSRFTPGRVMPAMNLASAGLLIAAWLVDPLAPRAVGVAVYLHLATMGGLLVSGFWSLVNERFDPRSARRHIGTIGAGATVGGLLGGLLVERLGSMAPGLTTVLPVLAGMQLILAWRLRALARSAPAATPEPASAPLSSAVRSLRASPQLVRLSLLVVVGAAAAAVLDYVFKAGVAGAHPGEPLLRFFALYYAVTGLATVGVQALLGRFFALRCGPTASLSTLPAAVALFGAGAAAFPGAVARVLARGAENVFRNSLYRSGYELLFAPLPERDKRATKTLIDVAFERVGDVAGALLISTVLALHVASERLLLGLAVALGLLGLAVVASLQRGQRAALAQSLRTRSSAAESAASMALLSTRLPVALDDAIAMRSSGVGRLPVDPLALAAAALRSGDAARVARALRGLDPLPPSLVAHVIPLLGWDEVAEQASAALITIAPSITGQLLDRLLDPAEEFVVRRRLPAVLEHGAPRLAAWGLLESQSDIRFEVRFRTGRVLQRLQRRHPELALDGARLLDAVRREVVVDRAIWENQQLLDPAEGDDPEADRPMEHVFRLLSLAFPGEEVALAFRSLGGDDPHLRGTALEYLANVLPADVRDALWPFLEPPAQLARGTR